MKYLQKIPAVIKPPPPEKIIGNLSWVQNDEHLIEYIKVRTRYHTQTTISAPGRQPSNNTNYM